MKKQDDRIAGGNGLSRRTVLQIGAAAGAMIASPAIAQKKYDVGVTDKEIKLGLTGPYSGPASAYGVQGKAGVAYFNWINENGGINGRKINLISLDDGYSPPRTVEQTRKLVEQDRVFAIFGSIGTPTNLAIVRYLNQRKVPHLFIGTGAPSFFDPAGAPMTIPWQPNYALEGSVWAAHAMETKPGAKIAVLSPNDDFGRANLNGFKARLGDQAKSLIIAEQTYETSDPSVDPQVITLAGSKADIFINLASPKFTSQSIRKAYDIGWRPTQYLASGSNSVEIVLEPAGIEKAVGLLSVAFMKDPSDPRFADDAATKDFLAWHAKYYPDSKSSDSAVVMGVNRAFTMAHALRACGDELTRENLMKQASSIKDLVVPMVLPGITFNTTPTDYSGIRSFQVIRFDGKRWGSVGNVIKA